MYCSLGQNQFFDDAGAPLSAGRVKIYAKGSDTLLQIYEDNGDGFVPAQNPVTTANDGRIPTVFWPAALVDVVAAPLALLSLAAFLVRRRASASRG